MKGNFYIRIGSGWSLMLNRHILEDYSAILTVKLTEREDEPVKPENTFIPFLRYL